MDEILTLILEFFGFWADMTELGVQKRRIYGKIRYMTSDSAARKFNLKPYLEKWGNSEEFAGSSYKK